jgi:HD-GYP domain-containing protein (c-di-GMP phosphodiesterase class II)
MAGGADDSVNDTVEAMAAHRPYRPAHGVEAALAEIEQHRGTWYDPAVADACLKVFREGTFSFSG